MRWARGAMIAVLVVGALSTVWALVDEEFEAPLPELRVEVLNGCGETRLAAEVGERLRELGQDVRDERNAAQGGHERTVLIDRRGRPQLTRRLAQALGDVPVLLERREGAVVDVSLLVGADHARYRLLKAPAGR